MHSRISPAVLWLAFAAIASPQSGTGCSITEHSIPTAGSEPGGIVTGPDGALWFTEFTGNNIGRITTIGVFTEYPAPTGHNDPWGITGGPGGALWFTDLAPRIAMRAYEIYERRGRHDGQADQDWLDAEREVTPKGSR
jgi:streptogramin lyase